MIELFNRGSELLVLPFLARAVELEQLVRDRQRLPGQVAFSIGEVQVEVVHYIERAEHSPPVAGIGAHVGVNSGQRRRHEAQLLHGPRLEEPA